MPSEQVTRKVFWNISPGEELLFYLLGALAVGIFAYGIYGHVRRILAGKAVGFSWGQILAGFGSRLRSLAANRTVRSRHAGAGLMHLLIMWGFLALFLGTIIIAIEYDLFQKLLGPEAGFWKGSFFLGYELVLDLLGALFILGLGIALIRRYLWRAPQLRWTPVDLLFPLWLLLIGVTGFLIEGMRLSVTAKTLTYSSAWSPVGFLLSQMWTSTEPETMQLWHWALWWFHGFLALGWIAYAPFAPKVIHVITAGMNFFLEDLRPRGRLSPVNVEEAFERNETLGVEKVRDLTRKDILDLMSCTECGRCEMNCPAHLSGKLLSPRAVILNLRDHVTATAPWRGGKGETEATIIGGAVQTEEIWACTTCMACVEACPVYIDPLNKIHDLRRNQVMMQDSYPESFADVFGGTQKRGNPWNQHPTARMDWASGLDVKTMAEVQASDQQVEYLFWVGCSAAFDARNQKIARSLVQILKAARVSFAVLGDEESCTGDPVRRIGHEYLFQIQAKSNVDTLKRYSFQKILTLCPHCFNCLGREYPDFGGSYKVIHHTQLISQLLSEGKIKLTKPVEGMITYHDSCYLGRYNRLFDVPRDILRQIPGLTVVEMERNRETGMCCGAGGGLMWIEEEPDKRVNQLRVDQAEKAIASAQNGPSGMIASACPFCMTMMEDGLAARESSLRDRDLAELVAESMGLI